MGAINFIDSNPTTAAIRVNQARDTQQAAVESQLLDARDRRRAAIELDQNAGIVADAMAPRPPSSPIAQVAPAQPQGDGMLAPVAPTAQTYAAEQPKPVSALAAVAPDPYSRASAALHGRPGSGAIRMKLAEAKQKQDAAAHAEAIKAFGTGDFELAQALNQRHGLGLDSVFANPSALQTSRMLAGSIQHLKMEPGQTVAYMDAATQKFAEVYGQTRDPKQAMNAAGMAGMTAARGVRPKGTGNLVETPSGYFNRDTGDYEKDKDGKVLKVPDRRLHFNTGGGAGGGAGGANSKGAKFDVDGDGYRVILYRDGTMVYPKDKNGNPVKIKAGTNEDQKFVRNLVAGAEKNRFPDPGEDPVARAKDLARQTNVGGTPGQPAPAPKARIRFDANGNQIK